MRPLPFPVKAWFDTFVVLFFSIDKNKMMEQLPYPLNPDCYKEHALLAVAIVKTKNFRPSFLPSWMGMKFNLVGYRFLSTYQLNETKSIRGLKIIKSQTDQKFMKFFGDKLSQYKFNYNPIKIETRDDLVIIEGEGIDIKLRVHENPSNTPLPTQSVFENWPSARKYAGPLLYTFEINMFQKQISITEGTRKNWTPKPIEVISYDLEFLKQENISSLQPMLSAAFQVTNIPYSWKKATIQKFA